METIIEQVGSYEELLTFNRTTVGWKRFSAVTLRIRSYITFNRTTVGWKRRFRVEISVSRLTFNRTTVGWKRMLQCKTCDDSKRLLIAPQWDGNISTAC